MTDGAAARRRKAAFTGRGPSLLAALFVVAACSREKSDARPSASASASHPRPPSSARGPALDVLYLEESPALPPVAGDGLLPPARLPVAGRSLRCPAEMVEVRGEFCIDRFEVTLVDAGEGGDLSPFYHPTRALTIAAFAQYGRDTRSRADAPTLPVPAPFQLEADPVPRARVMEGVIPQGYLSAVTAEAACNAAGKRLCSLTEWITACRGEQNRKFPYGDTFSVGKCNVFRSSHPAFVLHRDASREHRDPRLNLVADAEGPLLRKTGETPTCRSEWGSDAVFDMVGNVDEWVADGSFVGGFYARATREGCDARISSHAREYFDYSLGTRCCRSLGP